MKRKNSSDQSDGDRTPQKRGSKPIKGKKVLYFACPLTKHDPVRYQTTTARACTGPPGLPIQRVMEHLRRTHSPQDPREKQCRFCEGPWITLHIDRDARLNEVETHLQTCRSSRDAQLKQPEYLTRQQEDRLDALDRRQYGGRHRDQWHQIYVALYPGQPIPNPMWDYFTPTHLVHQSRRESLSDSLPWVHSRPVQGFTSPASQRSASSRLVGQARQQTLSQFELLQQLQAQISRTQQLISIIDSDLGGTSSFAQPNTGFLNHTVQAGNELVYPAASVSQDLADTQSDASLMLLQTHVDECSRIPETYATSAADDLQANWTNTSSDGFDLASASLIEEGQMLAQNHLDGFPSFLEAYAADDADVPRPDWIHTGLDGFDPANPL